MRTLAQIGRVIIIIGQIIDVLMVFRWNIYYGIPDIVMICFASSVLTSAAFALIGMPALVMFLKLSPKKVEATMMSFAYTLIQLSIGFLSTMMGVLVNKYFVGVKSNDLSNYY